MGKHGALLRRVDPAPSSAVFCRASISTHSTRKCAHAIAKPRPVARMSQTADNGSPQPAGWSLWRSDNGIVFGGTRASAPATPNSTPRTVPPPAAATAPLQRPPWPNVAYPQLPLAAYAAPAVPFVPKRRMHNAVQVADDKPVQKPAEHPIENTAGDKQPEGEKKEEEEEPKEVLHPATTLDYKMPDDVFRTARDAAEGTPESYWLYTMYRKPVTDTTDDASNSPAVPTPVKVHYCKSKDTTERVCRNYFRGEPLLGFDLEWMPKATRWQGARRNVCLIQLATPSRIGLFHLSLFPKAKDGDKDSDLVGPALRSILEDESSIKAGVAIKGDATRVQKYLGVTMRGVFELSHLHRLVVHSHSGETHLVNKKLVSLAAQVQEHLRLPMFKGHDVRSSDWSRPLTMDQIIYSASDAYAAVQIFSVLELRRENLDPKPPRPAFVERNLPIKLADGGEAGDEAEEVVEDNSTTPAKTMSPEYLARAEKTVEFEGEGETDVGPATPAKTPTPKPKTPRTPRTPRAPAMPKDARISAAEEWLARFRESATSSGRTLRARPASLRAYHLWHGDETLEPAALAGLLRDPPLQTSTVVSYILDAVQLESLPYTKTRMRTELLDRMPDDLRRRKYAYLSKVCGYTAAAQT